MVDRKKGLEGFTGEEVKKIAKAVRLYCLECVCGSYIEVEHCPIKNCRLYPFRFGIDPYRKSLRLSEEERTRRSCQIKRHHKFSKRNEENEGVNM